MVHRGGLETVSEKNKKDDFNICIAEIAKTADGEIYDEQLAPKTKQQTKRTVKKALSKSTSLPLSDHSISQSVVRVERSRFIKKKTIKPNSKADSSAKSTCISPVRAGLRSNSLESHTSTTSNNNNAKGKRKKANISKKAAAAAAAANAKPPQPIDLNSQETVNPFSDDSKSSQSKLSPQLPLTFVCSVPLDRLTGILDHLKIDRTLTKCLPGAEEDTSLDDKPNVDQNSTQCKTLCLYCDKRMSTVKVRARHIERFHTISKERRSSTRNPVAPSQDSKDYGGSLPAACSSSPSTPKSSTNLVFSGCSFCSKSPKLQAVALETDLNALFYHLVDLHSDKYFGCKLCAIRFQNAAKLDDHVQRTHIQLNSKTTHATGDVNSPDEDRSVSEFGKSTPTKTRRQIKQMNAESGRVNSDVFSPPTKAGSSTSSSVSRNGSMFSNDEPILSRLGVTQNRLPRGRKGIRSRRQTNVDGVKPETSLISVKTRSKVGRVFTSNEPIETVFRTPTNTRTEPLSCTFDDDFYEKVFVNVRNNLGCHLDGKLGKDSGSIRRPQSPPPLIPAIRSTVVKSPQVVESEVHTATSLAALTAFPTLLTAEQYGCDFGSAKIKRPITKHSWKWKWDSVKKYKYVNEGGKIVKKIKQPMLGLRDLSKLDMWTQLTMRQKHEVARRQAETTTSSSCFLEQESSREEKQKQIDQLNTILDSRRLPQIILEQNEQTIIKLEITDEGLRYLTGETSANTEYDGPSSSLAADRVIPANLNLIPSRSLGESVRHTVVLSGEWARPRCYVCFGCGARFDKLKALEEHKMFRHPHVYSTHYEIVGRELIEGNLYKHFFIPMKALSRHREYAQGMLVNKKTEDSVTKSSSNSANEDESLDSLHSVTISFTTVSSSKLSDDCDTDTKTAIENVSSSYTEPSTISTKNDSSPTVVSSSSVHCTKCNRNCHGILELYRHMLDCSGDYAWLLAKKKKYRYYGSRKRRQFNKHNISALNLHKRKLKRNKDEHESDATPKKKTANMSPSTPRPRPSDADSIRKMLENLPPKRVCREIIPNATKPRARKFKTTVGRKLQQNSVNKKCKSSNATLTAISKKLLRNHKLRAISEKDKISRSNKILENKRKSARVNSSAILVSKTAQSQNRADKKTEPGSIVRKIGATTKRFVKKIKKHLLGKKKQTEGDNDTAVSEVEKTTEKKSSKVSAVRKLTFDKEQDACNEKKEGECKDKPKDIESLQIVPSVEVNPSENKPDVTPSDERKNPIPAIPIDTESEWKKSQDILVSENPSSLRSEGSMENLHQHQGELSTSTEDLIRGAAGFLQNQVSPTTKRRSKKINDCIAMLTGKLQEKLGKPFLECKATAANDGTAQSQVIAEVSNVPPSNESKDTKPPKRKAFTRRIVKCDQPPVEQSATLTLPPPVVECAVKVTEPQVTPKESPIIEPPVTKPTLFLEPPVKKKPLTYETSAKQHPLVNCQPKMELQKPMSKTPAFNEFIPVPAKKAPPPIVTVEITTAPPVMLKELPKKSPATERKQPPKQQCVINADTIRVPCIKPSQLSIPQFTPAQIPLPRGMISKRRQTIAGAPNDFLSEMNSIRSANNYNNLPFELEVPLDLSKKPKRSSPKGKANPRAFPPHHHPQISVKPNAVLMPPMPFHLPILPQTQIIPILCEPLQQKVPQISLQGPPVVFAKEVAAKSPIVPRKRSNRKQESSANIDMTPQMINLIKDTPSLKKVHKTPTVVAEEKLNSILVSETPAAPAKKKQNLIKESILSLPVEDDIGLPKVNEELILNTCELKCKEKPNRVDKLENVVQPIAKLPTEVECVPAPIHNLMEEAKVSPAPMLIATPAMQIVKPATMPSIDVEEIVTTQVIDIDKPETTPKMEIHKAVAAPDVKIHNPVITPLIEIDNPVTSPVVEIHEHVTSPVSDIMEAVTTLVMKIGTLTPAKEITKNVEFNEIKDSKETTALATTNKKPKQSILKKGSSPIPAGTIPIQTTKQSDVLDIIDQKCELSPESQRSLPTRRSRRNKAGDDTSKNTYKLVVNDVRPAALKEVEEIAASFLSEDEQENEDVLPGYTQPKTVEVKTTETSEVGILSNNDHEGQNEETLNVQTANPDEKDTKKNNVKATEMPKAEKRKLDKDINNAEPTQMSSVEILNPLEKGKKKNEVQPTEWPLAERTKHDETDKKKNDVKPINSPKAEKAKQDKIDKQMSEGKDTEPLNAEKANHDEIEKKNNEIKSTESSKTEKANFDDIDKKKNAVKIMEFPQAEKAELDDKDKEKKNVEVSIECETSTPNKKLSPSTAQSSIPSTKNESKDEVTASISQDISKKPRRRRKNELAAIVADQLMESFKEVDKSRIDDLKKLENLAYEKSEDLLLTGMRLMPTTKRKNVLDHKKEITGENETKVVPTKEAKKQKSELAKEKKMAKDGIDRDTQKVDVKMRNQKEDVEMTKVPNSKADVKPNSLPLDFGNYRTNSVDSWSHRGPAQIGPALLSPENEKSPNNDLIGMHKKSKKKQMKKRDKKIEIENINQLRTGLESFTFSKDIVVDTKEDTPLLNRSAEQQLSIVGLFTPTQRNTSTADSAKEPEVSAFASLANVKTTSSILRPSILAASLDIATNKENPVQSDRKSCISSRDPRLNKNIHTDEGDQVAIAPETSTRLSTLRQRRKSLADVTAPTQAIRSNSRSTNKRSDANSRRASLAFDDDDDDNYLTAIAKRVNDKIMSAEDKDFNLANDGFELASSFLDMDDPYGRPSTSMSVRSAPNFNEDRSNMDTMDATNTDLIDMDVDDDMSVYTTFSQDTTRSVKGRRRRRRRSVLLTRKPKKTNINTMEPTEMFDCLLCNKTFAKATALNKHQLTIAHVTKVSEQEYLNATRKQEVIEQAPPVITPTAKKPIAKIPPAVVAESPKQNFSAIQSIRLEESNIPSKPHEIHEKLMERLAEKPTQPKVPYIPPNSILNQSGIEPISSPEQNYERYSTKTSSRLTLNPDERLFYECCNILKGSETPLVERTYPVVPPTTYAYDLQVKPVTPKSTNERYSYIKQSTAEACGKREAGAYPRLDVNQFSDISSDSNPACAQPPPILPINYAQMHVLSAAKDQAVLPNDDGDGGALRSNLARENPVLQMASLSSPNPIAPLTARTFVNQPSQIGPHLHGMESAATVTQKQNFISPLHSASSQSSTITTTTCRLKTKAAMKGYDNLKVSIPTIGLDMEHALERSPRAGCKLTTLAEIALGNETPMTGLTSFTPAMQMQNDHKSKCKIKPNDLAEQFPIMLSQPKENQMPPQSKRREKSPVKESSPIISVHDTESCMPILLSPPKKPESIIAKDIYEFDDSENTPISKAIQSPFKTADDNDGSPKKAIIIPERPFKNIGMEEKEAIKFQKPETPAINDDNTTSTVTYSDRDDFVYGSISGGEDDNDNENDDNKECNLNSAESSNSSAFTAKTFENKSLIMGRIFKNAKTKPKIPVEKPKLPTPEPPKQIPKQELDRLFDTLRGLNENRQANAAKEERLLEIAPNSSRNREVQPSKKTKTAPKPPKPKTNTNKTNRKAATKAEPSSKEIAQLHTELGMSPAEIAELIGEGQRKSQRRCAVNRPKKLVEIWSSDEFEEFLSTKDIIALIEEKEQKTKRKRKTSSTARKSHPPPTPAASNNNTKTATDENITIHQSEDEKASTSPRKTPKITPKAATENAKKVKPVKGKKKGPTATANVMATKVKPIPKAQKEVKSSASSRRNSEDAPKSKTSSPFKKPRNLSKTTAADDSESDFEAELHRKSKGAPIRNRRKTISGKLENDAGSSSCAKKDSGKSKIVSESPAPRKSSTSKQPPADSQVRPQARRKRIASEMLYYWSSSSDEEFGRIESPHDDEDHIDESENYQQHGWIVGDSHKKLVTLLAIAKGNKKVDDCGVKETNSKKKS